MRKKREYESEAPGLTRLWGEGLGGREGGGQGNKTVGHCPPHPQLHSSPGPPLLLHPRGKKKAHNGHMSQLQDPVTYGVGFWGGGAVVGLGGETYYILQLEAFFFRKHPSVFQFF